MIASIAKSSGLRNRRDGVAQDRDGVDGAPGVDEQPADRARRVVAVVSREHADRLELAARAARERGGEAVRARGVAGLGRDRPAQVGEGGVELAAGDRREAGLVGEVAIDRRREPGRPPGSLQLAQGLRAILRGRGSHAAARGREAFGRLAGGEQAGRDRQPRRGDAGRVRQGGEPVHVELRLGGRRAGRRDRPGEREPAGLDGARAALEQPRGRLVLREVDREVVRHPHLPSDALVAAEQALDRRQSRR